MTRSRMTACWITPAALALVSGCTVGPDYRPPETPAAPGTFHAASEPQTGPSRVLAGNADLARWWTGLNDPLLDSLVERAVAANLDLKVATARVREARAQRGVTAAREWPEVDAVGSYSRSRQSEYTAQAALRPPESSGGSDLYQAGFDATWELDVFGAVRRSVEAADADVQAAEESRRDTLVSLLAEVARNYVDARSAQRRVAIAQRAVQVQQETLDIVSARLAARVNSELEVAQARAQLQTRRSQLPSLETAYRQSVYRLGVLLGLEPGALLDELNAVAPIPSVPPEVPVGLPSDLVRRRADVRRAERQLGAATARVGVATADLYPRFSLTGSFVLQSNRLGDLPDLDSRAWAISPAVRWPLFDAGRVRANIRVQDARVEQALAQYEKAVLTSFEETENAITGFVKEQSRREALAAAAEANRLAFDLAGELYKGGLKDFLNVLQTQAALYESEDALAQSDRTVTANLIALYKALGGGWESVEIAKAPNDQSAK